MRSWRDCERTSLLSLSIKHTHLLRKRWLHLLYRPRALGHRLALAPRSRTLSGVRRQSRFHRSLVPLLSFSHSLAGHKPHDATTSISRSTTTLIKLITARSIHHARSKFHRVRDRNASSRRGQHNSARRLHFIHSNRT